MKSTKTFFTLGICAIVITVCLGIYVSNKPKTVDFRGVVEEISQVDDEVAYLQAVSAEGIRRNIKIDSSTAITLSGGDKFFSFLIEEGDLIDVNFKRNFFDINQQEEAEAKSVTVYPNRK